MDLKISSHALFFGGRRRLFLYHNLNGAVVGVSEGVRQMLLPLFEELKDWTELAELWEAESAERVRERLLGWRLLVAPDSDEESELREWYPLRSIWSVFYLCDDRRILRARYERERDAPVVERLDELETMLWLACDGTRTMDSILEEFGAESSERVVGLLRSWTRWDRQLLKWLPRPYAEAARAGLPSELLSHTKDLTSCGSRPASPWKLDALNLESYYRTEIEDAKKQFDWRETTLSYLFRVPHRALGGRTYGGALAHALIERSLLKQTGGTIVEVGAGTGAMAKGFLEALNREAPEVAAQVSYTIVELSPTLASAQQQNIPREFAHTKTPVRWIGGSAERLPLRDGSVDLLISNEVIADLSVERDERSGELENRGALRFVEEIARVVKPSGGAVLTEYGELDAPVRPAEALDHAEHTIRYDRLLARAHELGLEASLETVGQFLGFDDSTRLLYADVIHMAELREIARALGGELEMLAYTPEMLNEALRDTLDLTRLGNLSFAPLRACSAYGVAPDVFKAMLLRAPE
ncbi:MAG TPA: SAM-dependent methyltransferase [Pyrinomonadaceae bacterium]|jgi:SAM-dependent methyltransferase